VLLAVQSAFTAITLKLVTVKCDSPSTSPQATSEPVPVLYFSLVTCTEETFMIKAGAQRFAAEYGMILVAPDTSPRNTGIEGEDNDWDFGTGASFTWMPLLSGDRTTRCTAMLSASYLL